MEATLQVARRIVTAAGSKSTFRHGSLPHFLHQQRFRSGVTYIARGDSLSNSLSSQCESRKYPMNQKRTDPMKCIHGHRRGYCAPKSSSSGEVINVPEMGESITEGTLASWEKSVGEHVETDDVVAQLETDKITVDVRSPRSGVLAEILAEEGETKAVGDPLFRIEDGEGFTKDEGGEKGEGKVGEEKIGSGEGDTRAEEKGPVEEKNLPEPVPVESKVNIGQSGERRVAMTRMRKRIAERLKEAQNTAAMLTTFNEVDMTELMSMRRDFKEAFEKKHGAKLGFMSAFVKASAVALHEQPEVNAFIDGDDIVYRDYVDISVAVSTPGGLVVPVIRSCENMNFADIEKTIVTLGERARTGKISIDEMQGGTFTISNGGVFGSLLSTPIINMPQSAILGMHIIQKRPVAMGDQVVIRPMMYLALSYDHRLIDGREAVFFLRRVKTLIEDPRRLLLEIDL